MIKNDKILAFLDTTFLHKRLLGRLSNADRGPIGPLCTFDSLSGRTLWKFALARPQKFFSHHVFRDTLAVLAKAEAQNVIFASEAQEALRHALVSLRAQNATYPDIHLESRSNAALVLDQIQTEYLSDYVTIAESIYKHILSFLLSAHFATVGIQKNVGHKLRDLHDQAKRYLPASFHEAYNPIARNAISHGSIRILSDYDVEFTDANSPPLKIAFQDCPALADRQIDACNATYAAVLYATLTNPTMFTGLADWASEEVILSLGSNEMFSLERIREDVINGCSPQTVIFGTHSIWDDRILIDCTMRSLILCKALRGDRSRYLLSTSRGGPTSLFISDHASVPAPSVPVDLSSFAGHVLRESLLWNEHTSFVEWITSQTRIGHVVNWIREHERGIEARDSFEVREIKNNSVSRQSRFDAVVLAKPSQNDLDPEGLPRLEFLWSVFAGVFTRWFLRGGNQRNFGSRYLRLFRSGLIYVYHDDARVRALRNTGLNENLLFRFEFSLGKPECGIALGGRAGLLKRNGPFVVSLNPNATQRLRSIAVRV
ncbi:MAG: hypothetical protein IPK80_01440 [Nannocystis sp.]|nr:hypothetical protein [Nannocystis sp.]